MTYDFEAWRRAMNEVADECVALLERKQKDYGPKNIANAPGGPLTGLMVRMYDKIARIENLMNQEEGAVPQNESLEDSFMDLANYGIIGVMVLKGYWPGSPYTIKDSKLDKLCEQYGVPASMRKPGTVIETDMPERVRAHLLGGVEKMPGEYR